MAFVSVWSKQTSESGWSVPDSVFTPMANIQSYLVPVGQPLEFRERGHATMVRL